MHRSGASRDAAHRASCSRCWNRRRGARETTRGVRDRRHGRCKAAPAARRGRSINRGAARRRPPTATGRGSAADARAAPRSSEPDAGRSKLTDAKARPSCPRNPNRANGHRAGKGAHSVRNDARLASCAHKKDASREVRAVDPSRSTARATTRSTWTSEASPEAARVTGPPSCHLETCGARH
jgi:hypothetical protein